MPRSAISAAPLVVDEITLDGKRVQVESVDMPLDQVSLRDVRGTAIHVRPRNVPVYRPGDPGSYEHIPGAPHSDGCLEQNGA
jgi:hypothetical protein